MISASYPGLAVPGDRQCYRIGPIVRPTPLPKPASAGYRPEPYGRDHAWAGSNTDPGLCTVLLAFVIALAGRRRRKGGCVLG
jgi:hypothetical protein